MAMLEGRQLTKTYRAQFRAVWDVSLAIEAGSFAVFAGPSGSGKTTLLALLGGLERPTSGKAFFAGRDLHDCSDVELARVRRRIGFVFQNFALISGLPLWENITYPLIPLGVPRAERRKRAGELLERFGLANRLLSKPTELSGGEQQRVAVARAIVARPEVILADEPTSNLDEEAGQVIIDALRQLHQEGKTIVAASHDPRLIGVATRVFRLQAGKLAE